MATVSRAAAAPSGEGDHGNLEPSPVRLRSASEPLISSSAYISNQVEKNLGVIKRIATGILEDNQKKMRRNSPAITFPVPYLPFSKYWVPFTITSNEYQAICMRRNAKEMAFVSASSDSSRYYVYMSPGEYEAIREGRELNSQPAMSEMKE